MWRFSDPRKTVDTVFTRVPVSHLSENKRKELIRDMKKTGYAFKGTQLNNQFYVFSMEVPKDQKRFGIYAK